MCRGRGQLGAESRELILVVCPPVDGGRGLFVEKANLILEVDDSGLGFEKLDLCVVEGEGVAAAGAAWGVVGSDGRCRHGHDHC